MSTACYFLCIVRISNNLWRLRVNLFVIMAAYFVNTMMLDNTTPTLHQYVTNGRGGEVVNTNETYEVIITERAKQVEQHTIRLLLEWQ